MDNPLWSLELVRQVQDWATWLESPLRIATFLGSQVFFFLLILLFFWCISKPIGIDLAVLLLISGFANGLIKAFRQWPRPFWLDPSLQRGPGESFSYPSGHSQSSTMLFGYLSVRLARASQSGWRWLGVVLLVLLIAMVGLSRVYLGVHFPGDVLTGMVLGLVLLVVYLRLRPRLASWAGTLAIGEHVFLAIAAAGTVMWLNLVGLSMPTGLIRTPATWLPTAQAKTLAEAAMVAGSLAGLWIGLALEARFVRFNPGGASEHRVYRYLVGLGGALLIWIGLPPLVAQGGDPSSVGIQVLRAAVLGLWAAFLWPWLFVRFGWATREER